MSSECDKSVITWWFNEFPRLFMFSYMPLSDFVKLILNAFFYSVTDLIALQPKLEVSYKIGSVHAVF